MGNTSLQRLDQIAKPDNFNDQLSASQVAGIEVSATDMADFLKGMLSQFKRIIHGEHPGNWHDDPASVFGGDASLQALFAASPFSPVIQQDLLDNNIDYIVVGTKTIDRKVILDYSFELPISGRSLVGQFTLVHNGVSVDVDNYYSFIEPEISGVTFGASIVGNEIRLVIVTNLVGENPKIRYRKMSIGIAA